MSLTVAPGAGNVPQNERQTVTLGANTTGGTFTLTFSGSPTAAIDWDASPAAVQAALEALPSIGVGHVSVSSPNPGGGVIGGPFTIEFTGRYADTDVAQMTSAAANLTVSSGGKSAVVATAVPGAAAFETCVAAEAASCKAGISGTGAGMFNFGTIAIASIATDSTGNVYVPDPNNARVQKFSPSGGFLAMAGWNVDSVNPSIEYEVCTEAADCQAGTAGEASTQFASTGANSTTPGFLATSPAGDVYVVARRNGTIYRLTSALAFGEEYAAATAAAATTNPNRNAIAVNPADGHVFFGVKDPIAAGPDINIYELDPSSGAIVGTHPGDASYTPGADGIDWVGLAVNGDTGRMYGSRSTSATFVRAFEEGPPTPVIAAATENTGTKATLNGTVNPNGVPVTACFFEWGATTDYGNIAQCDPEAAGLGEGISPEAVQADISGLVPNGTTYHFRLVVENAHPTNGKAESDSQSFITPNTVVTQAASPFDDTTATLNGTVNPDGVAIDDCTFEYGTTTAYGQSVPCDPDGAGIGTGTNPEPVEADITDLHPGTVYHFRLNATYGDGIGPVSGADQSLQTLGPRILATWSEDVAVEEAFLKAEVDPEGVATTYRFEYGTDGPCSANSCVSIPDPDGVVGSDSDPHKVSRFLEGLQEGTTYHYRVVATDANDVVNEGPDHTFATFTRLTADTGCSNQIFRTGASRFLPDCRAYEMVSPIDKNGGDIETAEQEAGEGNPYSSAYRQASIHGGKVTYSSATAFGDAIGGHSSNQYLSTRGEHGWLTHGISSRRESTLTDGQLSLRWQAYPFFGGFTPDLSSAWIRDDNTNPLTPDALDGYVNLYRRDNLTDSYQALTTQGPLGPAVPILAQDGVAGGNVGGPRVVGHSSDLRHQVFTASAALTPDASQASVGTGTNTQLYDFVEGELHLVSKLPSGQAARGNSFAGTSSVSRLVETRSQMLKNAISDDGSRIVWTTTNKGVSGDYPILGPGAIYVRRNTGEEESARLHGAAEGTGSLTSGSPTVSSVATTSGAFEVGQTIAGNGIPAGTTITAVTPGSITLSANAIANGTGVTLESYSECTEPQKACTIPVVGSAALAGGAGITNPAQFWAASDDGSHLLYSLGGHPNRTLHLFDVENETTDQIAGQSPGVSATSEDLSRIYLVSREDHDGTVRRRPARTISTSTTTPPTPTRSSGRSAMTM